MEFYQVRDLNLATQGKRNINWAAQQMGALLAVKNRFEVEKPLQGLTVGMALHVTKETAMLVQTLRAGGADVAITGCNPLSTQDEVAAALAKDGVKVWAWKGETKSEYYGNLKRVVEYLKSKVSSNGQQSRGPARQSVTSNGYVTNNVTEPLDRNGSRNRQTTNDRLKTLATIDDGLDLVTMIHGQYTDLIPSIIGGAEETTTGVNRLYAMDKDGALKYPMVAVNQSNTKHLMDNRHGTGQSTIDGILRATSILLAGKTVVVAGFGECGKGVASRAAGMRGNVIVTEVDPLRALQAVMEGYRVMPMSEAAQIGDVFITVTGNKHVITIDHILKMKDGVILANSGHFDLEIDVEGLRKVAVRINRTRPFLEEFVIPSNLSSNGSGQPSRGPARQSVTSNGYVTNNVTEPLAQDGSRNRQTTNDKRIYLCAEGRLVNLAAAEGHPSAIMAMSFANQALAIEWLVENQNTLLPRVYVLPQELDDQVAQLQLKTLGIEIDRLTDEQQKYLSGWQEGT